MALVISKIDYEKRSATITEDPSVPEPPPVDLSQARGRMWLPELQAWCYDLGSQAIINNLEMPKEFDNA